MRIASAREFATATRRLQTIIDSSAANGYKLTAEQQTESNSLKSAMDDFISSASGISHSVASVEDVSNPAGLSSSSQVRVLPPTSEQMEHHLGVYLQCQIISGIDRKPAHEIAAKHFKNDFVASAAMHADDHGRGGAWISGQFSERFIEALTPMSVVRSVAVGSLTLDDGTLTVPKVTSLPTGYYLGEQQSADNETVGTGDVKLIAKELVVQVTASEKLVRSTSANAADRIRQSVLRGAAKTEDLYFLRGAPSGAGPTGLRYLMASGNVIAMNATVNLANVTADLGRLEYLLAAGDVDTSAAAWIMNPRTAIYLMDLRDGNGNLAWPGLQLEKPRLRGKRVHVTTQIPVNLGGGTESEIMLVAGQHVLIGDGPRVGFESSNVAAYNDGGTIKAAFSERKVVSRLVIENDINLEHDQAVAVLTGVTWGA